MTTPQTVPAQTMSLLPGYDQDAEYKLVNLDDLPPDAELHGPAPDRQMVKSVQALGVLQPVVLVREADGSLKVAEGRRRVKAARIALRGEVPAHIYPAHWADRQVLALVTNAHRSANPLSDYLAIKDLTGMGADVDDICRQLGMDRALVKSRLGLDKLNQRLYAGMMEGKVPVQVAVESVKCQPEVQQRLADKLDLDGRVTVKDVRDARRVAAHAGVDSLPADIFDVPNAAAPAPVNAPMPQSSTQVRTVYRMDPDGLDLLKRIFRDLQSVRRLSESKCVEIGQALDDYLATKVAGAGEGAQDGTSEGDADGDQAMEGA